MHLANITFRNEVATKYANEKKQSPNHCVKKGRFDKIVKEIRLLWNIPDEVTISPSMIQCWLQYDNILVSNINGGCDPPLLEYELYFIDMIIKLGRCRHSIITSEGLHLINSLIQKPEIQKKVKQ